MTTSASSRGRRMHPSHAQPLESSSGPPAPGPYRLSALCCLRGGPVTEPAALQDQRPADQYPDDSYQKGREPVSETQTMRPIVTLEQPGWRFRLEPRAVLARELIGVQSHLGRERFHVRPPE